ncbi:MAG: vitamin B12 dependent-methionine synthase activation domain-containing protein, partial [Deferribacterota bacterium]|nr:vitamin B12 dependent-methionine synthase activation domain-containing protein [Deferribacterota bacterium]
KKEFEQYKRLIIKKELIEPKVAYGYFKCKSFGNFVKVYGNKEDVKIVMEFPRQQKEPYLSIADYFLSEEDKSCDIIAFQVVTLGEKPVEYMKSIFSKDKYKEYYMMHGLFAELAEALAEMVHKIIRVELNIENKETKYNYADYLFNMKYRGKRYSFGYPSCPDLRGNQLIGKILPLEKIGVSITEDFQMIPEYTTSAFIVHNESAKYFTLK